MQEPMVYMRRATVDHSATVAGVEIDLYPAAHGAGWWTPAGPIFALAGFVGTDADKRALGLTGLLSGYEGIWDWAKPEGQHPVALLSANAVAGVFINAATPVDLATVAAIEAAMKPS